MSDLIDSTAHWFADVICGRAPLSVRDIGERCAPSLVDALGAGTLVASLDAMARTAQLISGPDVTAGGFRVEVSLAGDRRWEIRCQVDDAARIASIIEGRTASADVVTVAVAVADLDGQDLDDVHGLFDRAYGQADHQYLVQSMSALGTIGLARRRGRLVAFAVGGQRVADLPGVGPTRVLLAGLCCVHPDHRRQGLAGRVENLSIGRPTEPAAADHVLMAGRAAHPASYRQLAHRQSAVPKPGQRLSALHRLVGGAVADLYGVADFDSASFVCHGSGRPVGRPVIEVAATVAEEALFTHVDRGRGDTLLALAWITPPPAGW